MLCVVGDAGNYATKPNAELLLPRRALAMAMELVAAKSSQVKSGETEKTKNRERKFGCLSLELAS